jgi:putative ABC transport system substrate-binding protein
MNNRRKLLVALGAGSFIAPLHVFAQQPAKIIRIGFLGSESATTYARQVEALRAGLRELGYAEGKNLVIEFRWAEGKYDRLPELAAELVGLKVDVIVTHSTYGARRAKQATTTIPIVFVSVGDPIAAGLMTSLARPGGNITGLSNFNDDLSVKRLDLLKEAFPRIRRVAVLFANLNPTGTVLQAMEVAAKPLKLELHPFSVKGPNEFEGAFSAMSQRRVEAVVITDTTMFIANAREVASLAAKHRIPSIGFIDIAETGGLMAYGANRLNLYHRAAFFIDKILKGTKPGDLPVERSTTFELVINAKAAKDLGIKIPQSLLQRADRVIE